MGQSLIANKDLADLSKTLATIKVMRVMKLMEAIFQSAETNQVIDYRQYES